MEKFDYSELNKMEKPALILLVMQLYKVLEQFEDKKRPNKSGVYMQGTSDTVKNYYESTLKAIKDGE